MNKSSQISCCDLNQGIACSKKKKCCKKYKKKGYFCKKCPKA